MPRAHLRLLLSFALERRLALARAHAAATAAHHRRVCACRASSGAAGQLGRLAALENLLLPLLPLAGGGGEAQGGALRSALISPSAECFAANPLEGDLSHLRCRGGAPRLQPCPVPCWLRQGGSSSRAHGWQESCPAYTRRLGDPASAHHPPLPAARIGQAPCSAHPTAPHAALEPAASGTKRLSSHPCQPTFFGQPRVVLIHRLCAAGASAVEAAACLQRRQGAAGRGEGAALPAAAHVQAGGPPRAAARALTELWVAAGAQPMLQIDVHPGQALLCEQGRCGSGCLRLGRRRQHAAAPAPTPATAAHSKQRCCAAQLPRHAALPPCGSKAAPGSACLRLGSEAPLAQPCCPEWFDWLPGLLE